jgi:GNAT superfamily N-acetyltransferase
MKTLVRPAQPTDTPVIFEFIKQLAVYEKLEAEVVGDEPSLHKHLFEHKCGTEVLIAELENKLVGFALYFTNFSTFLTRPGFYLEGLFVLPEHRGAGVGRALLKHLAALAVSKNYGRVEWSCLDWNEDALGFYRKIGATPQSEWTVQRLTGAALQAFAKD